MSTAPFEQMTVFFAPSALGIRELRSTSMRSETEGTSSEFRSDEVRGGQYVLRSICHRPSPFSLGRRCKKPLQHGLHPLENNIVASTNTFGTLTDQLFSVAVHHSCEAKFQILSEVLTGMLGSVGLIDKFLRPLENMKDRRQYTCM